MNQLSIFSSNSVDDGKKKVNWTLYIDGASRGNPGMAGAGVVLLKNNKVIAKKSYFLGLKTNNQAEYMSLINGLKVFKEQIPQIIDHLTIYSDSELLVCQIGGTYKIKHPELRKLYDEAMLILSNVDYKIEHIRREKNTIADSLANKALDEQKYT